MRVVYPDASPTMRALLDAAQLALLQDFVIYEDRPRSEAELIARLEDAWGVVLGWSYISEHVMAACPKLRVISFTGTGVSNFVDLEAANRHGVIVANTPHYGDDTVAEHTFALLLALVRNIPRFDRLVRQGHWQQDPPGRQLCGKTLGLLGTGEIGSRVARLGQAFGMRVLAWTAHPSPERAAVLGVAFVSLEELARNSDVISVHLALNEGTRRLVGRSFLEKVCSSTPAAARLCTPMLWSRCCAPVTLPERRWMSSKMNLYPWIIRCSG